MNFLLFDWMEAQTLQSFWFILVVWKTPQGPSKQTVKEINSFKQKVDKTGQKRKGKKVRILQNSIGATEKNKQKIELQNFLIDYS